MKHFLFICLILSSFFGAACSSGGKNNEWYANAAFLKALQLSDFKSVSGYIYTSNINVKSQDKNGDTPLTLAVQYSTDAELIQTLIDVGIDPNAVNKQGYNALMFAAKNNINPNIAKAIIMTGADIEQADPSGKTPLMLAAENNKNKNVILLFLQAGAQGRNDPAFRQALIQNVNLTQADINFLLMGKIENTVKIPWYNSTEFKAAFQSGDTKKLMSAVRKTDLTAKEENSGMDASSLLSEHKNIEELVLFVRNGVNINTQDKDGKTLLYKAAQEGDDAWLKALITVKADPNIRAKDATTPVMAAVLNQPEKLGNIKALIQAGANLNAGYNREGSTLIFKLIEENKDPKLIDFLIKNGAEINLKNARGNTPLILAAANAKDDKIINLLLENNANIDSKNNQGFTALLTAATSNPVPEVTLALMEKSKNKLDTGHIMDFAAQNQNQDVYNAVIKQLNAEFEERKNPKNLNDSSIWFNNAALVSAIRSGNTAVIKRELKKNLNLEALMKGQINALMLASAFSKTAEPINALVQAGADVNGTNNNGDTPLMTAVLTNKNLPVIQALISAGADVNATDNNGTSIIMAAANKNPNEKVPALLLQSGATVPDTRALLQYAQGNPNKKVYELLKKLFTVPSAQAQKVQ